MMECSPSMHKVLSLIPVPANNEAGTHEMEAGESVIQLHSEYQPGLLETLSLKKNKNKNCTL